MNATTQRRRARVRNHARGQERREGAAMLVVLMVLLMTSATASFAIHSTTMEMRSAGHSRQAMQARYVAEGGAYAALAYVDSIGAQPTFVQYQRTQVAMNVPNVPGAPTVDRQTNLFRVDMTDFITGVGLEEPPLETELAVGPSLGARNVYQPSFMVDGTDFYQSFRQSPGRNQTGNSAMVFIRMNMTARGKMGLAADYRAPGDERDYHETIINARAMAEMGPMPAQ